MDTLLLKKYIAGETLTPEEKTRIVEWTKAGEKNRAELAALHKLHDITIWQEPYTRESTHSQKTKSLFIYRVASIAVILLLMVGGSMYVSHIRRQIPEIVMQTIHVPPGQR
ncbi:MAG: hypothetical protein LBQ73_00315, partial [Tannerellaceae bacterium]|nr:hypothetical protein [Tannerellaceae bacterium]